MLVDAFVNVSEKRKFTLFIRASGNWWPCCSSCPPRKVTASIYRLYPATCGLKGMIPLMQRWIASNLACVAGGIVSAREIKFWTSERRSREENGERDLSPFS